MGNESDSTLFRSYLTACTEARSGAAADASEAARLAEELQLDLRFHVARALLISGLLREQLELLVSATVPALSALSAARVLEGELELLLLGEKGLDKRPAGK
jgi:hypothetical protein